MDYAHCRNSRLLRLFKFLGQTLFASLLANVGLAEFSSFVANAFGVLHALIVLYGIEAIMVVPFATCAMINDYHKAIAGQRVRSDLHGTLCSVSKKFRDLFSKSGHPMPARTACKGGGVAVKIQ